MKAESAKAVPFLFDPPSPNLIFKYRFELYKYNLIANGKPYGGFHELDFKTPFLKLRGGVLFCGIRLISVKLPKL
jgi:hypothetical protein